MTITISTGRIVFVRLIGEQHVLEDLGRIPSFADWMRCIRPETAHHADQHQSRRANLPNAPLIWARSGSAAWLETVRDVPDSLAIRAVAAMQRCVQSD